MNNANAGLTNDVLKLIRLDPFFQKRRLQVIGIGVERRRFVWLFAGLDFPLPVKKYAGGTVIQSCNGM